MPSSLPEGIPIQTSSDKLTKFYARCQAFVRRATTMQEPQADFPGWALEKYMGGRRTSLDNLWCDYVRERCGPTPERTLRRMEERNRQKRAAPPDPSRRRPLTREEIELKSQTRRYLNGASPMATDDSYGPMRSVMGRVDSRFDEVGSLFDCLSGHDRVLAMLYHKWELQGKEIAEIYRVSETRISQRLAKVHAALRTLLKTGKRLPQIDMEVILDQEAVRVSPKLREAYERTKAWIAENPGVSVEAGLKALGIPRINYYRARGVIEEGKSLGGRKKRTTAVPSKAPDPDRTSSQASRPPAVETPAPQGSDGGLDLAVSKETSPPAELPRTAWVAGQGNVEVRLAVRGSPEDVSRFLGSWLRTAS